MSSAGIVATRAANALIADARAKALGQPIDGVLGCATAIYGGLWVGGRATLTREQLAFHPNSVNRAIHSEGSLDIEIPLSDIEKVEVLPGVLTRIIAITTKRQFVKIRCFRADAFADEIRTWARSTQDDSTQAQTAFPPSSGDRPEGP